MAPSGARPERWPRMQAARSTRVCTAGMAGSSAPCNSRRPRAIPAPLLRMSAARSPGVLPGVRFPQCIPDDTLAHRLLLYPATGQYPRTAWPGCQRRCNAYFLRRRFAIRLPGKSNYHQHKKCDPLYAHVRADKLTLTFTPANGAYSGKFYDGLGLIPYGGVVLQKQEEGEGLFVAPDDSGQVLLTP